MHWSMKCREALGALIKDGKRKKRRREEGKDMTAISGLKEPSSLIRKWKELSRAWFSWGKKKESSAHATREN